MNFSSDDKVIQKELYADLSAYPSRCPICGRGGEPPLPKQLAAQSDLIISEPLLTLRQIADALNVPLFAVRRAAARKVFKVYFVGNGRRRARLSEVIAAIEGATK